MLSAKKELSDKISGLEIGADDYLPKPYNELELIARIYASLRTKALQDELRVKNAQLEELLGKVEIMAITDALTGLYNRRRFLDVLSKEFEKERRYSTPFSIIMMDIDFFKKINDNYSHQTGDRVLKEISDIISGSIREIDTAARYGGEEFVVVLPNTDKENARISAERMRSSISSYKFPEVSYNITVSFGISGLPDSLLVNQDKLLRCADYALYRAKQNGRNRVEVAEGKDLAKKS
jgi:diguanylate cyclase (GGDEF)-like protein